MGKFYQPYTETTYVPTFIRAEDGRLQWFLSDTQAVRDELQHLLDILDNPGVWKMETVCVKDDEKIKLIKAIREQTGLGLKESKDVADGAVPFCSTRAAVQALADKCAPYGEFDIFNPEGGLASTVGDYYHPEDTF
jgi:hypothetical protein